jgi:O-antigen ligase
MPPSPAHAPVAAHRDRIALRILQAGAVAIVLAAAPYKAFDLERYFVAKELVLHLFAATAALLCISSRRRITLAATDLLLVGFLLASATSAALASNGWLATRALAISTSGALLFWVSSALRRDGVARSLVAALALAVVVASVTSLLQAYGLDSEYFSLNRAPGGTFGNRNFVAHLAAVGTPALVLSALTARRSLNGLLGVAGLAIVAAVLVMSRSRGAWLAIIAFSIPVGSLALATRRRWRNARTARRLSILGVATVAGAVAAVVLPNRLEWTSDSPYLESAAGLVNYKEGSGRGRLVQYTNSVRMMRSDPLLGVGPGNWPVAYPRFAVRNDPSMSQDDGLTSNPWPSSDWVAFLSERGVVGAAFLALAFLALMRRALREVMTTNGAGDPERLLTAFALLATLIATVVVGAFDAVLLLAAPAFFVWTLAGALAPPGRERLSASTRMPLRGSTIVAIYAVLAIGRSSLQLRAMSLVSHSTTTATLERAARLDPGSYRIHVRLAEAYRARGNCARLVAHAREARTLLPAAALPRRLIASCGR